ncbi:MAG: hypothetical protein LBU45_04855, partial [Azoarcus sp.]|nr:hypothetical protein [Azoarcus sp.]
MTSVQFKAFPTQTARTLNSRNASTSTSAQLPAESAADKKAEEQQNSSKVTLSDLSKHLSQAMQMLKSPKNVSDASKSAARYQAALLKQQMDNLKKIAAMMGPIAAKSILRQIKQIAQQIGRIAAELGEPSPIAAGDANIGVASANAS